MDACACFNTGEPSRVIVYTKNECEGGDEEDECGEAEDDDSRPSHLSKIGHVPYRGLTVKLDESGEAFYNLVNDRRSVRKFDKNRTIKRSIVEKCILAAGKYTIAYEERSRINVFSIFVV